MTRQNPNAAAKINHGSPLLRQIVFKTSPIHQEDTAEAMKFFLMLQDSHRHPSMFK